MYDDGVTVKPVLLHFSPSKYRHLVLCGGAGRRLVSVLLTLCLVGGASACGGDDGGSSAGSSSTTSSSTTSTSATTTSSTTSTTKKPATPEEEVEAAYLNSWEVYAKAVRELDPSGLEEAYAKDALELRRKEVADLKAADTPVQIDVDHDYLIEFLEDGVAVVFDRYTNRSVRIDGQTGEQIDDDAPVVHRRAYQMERLGDRWKVVFVRSQD